MATNPPSRISVEYLCEDWKLPLKREAHDLMVYNAFDWTLLKHMDSKWRKIQPKCTKCMNKTYLQYWPVNWTTLADHYSSVHGISIEIMRAQATSAESGGIMAKEDSGGPLDKCFPALSQFKRIKLNRKSKRTLTCVGFDQAEYERLLLRMMVSNNLSFSLANADSFREFVSFLREDVKHSDRTSLRRKLESFYDAEMSILKLKLSQNTGRFAITIDEWNSSNNIDFLGITLHFYNNDFQLEKYTIGFEMLNENMSYTGEVIYEKMMKVLTSYKIDKKIISITRDNAGPMNVMMKKFKDAYLCEGIDFNGDIRCVGHILNLATDCILNYTFFKKTATQKFLDNVSKVGDTTLVDRMKVLPDKMRSIVSQMRYNHKAKTNFKKQVSMKKAENGTQKGPDMVVKDNATRWLSTHRMIDRFLHFRSEIYNVLRIVYPEQDGMTSIPPEFQLTDADWKYLEDVLKILEAFRQSTLKLQGSSYPTIHLTLSLLDSLVKRFDALLETDFVQENPLLACGIREAKSKVLQYFPLHDENIERLKPYYLAIVLNPRRKLKVFKKSNFPEQGVQAIKDYFYEVYAEYSTNMASDANEDLSEEPQIHSDGLDVYDSSDSEDDTTSEHEIERYLNEPTERRKQDPMEFFKSRMGLYPVISRIARDYFAMSAMSAPAEALFSQMADVITKKRNKLSPTTIKMLAILKSLGAIKDEDIKEYEAGTGDTTELSKDEDEKKGETEADDLLVLDDVEENEEANDTLLITSVFGEMDS